MNVLILATHLNRGGISRYLINLANGLSKRGHKVFVASNSGEWLDELEAVSLAHKYIPIRTKSIFSLKVMLSFFYLRKFVLRENIELIHANTRVTQCLAYLLYKSSRIPYISGFHGFYKAKTSRRMFKFQGLRSIAVSKAVKNHLVEDLEINKENIRVVYNGIDTSSLKQASSQRSLWGFKNSDFLTGILGRISAEKGHILAIEAIARLTPKYKNLYFIISGEGKLRDRVRHLVKEQKLEERVKFVNCPAADFLQTLDLLLVPSEKEGFGFSVIEAFAKNIPVVGYNTGGIAELIKHRQNGILFNSYNSLVLADSVEELITKPELRKQLTNRAREDVFAFSIERMASQTEKVYLEAIEA